MAMPDARDSDRAPSQLPSPVNATEMPNAAAVWPEGNENASGFSARAAKPTMPRSGRLRQHTRLSTCETDTEKKAPNASNAPKRCTGPPAAKNARPTTTHRSEEHTSELQS